MTKKMLFLLLCLSTLSCKRDCEEEIDTKNYSEEGSNPCPTCKDEKVIATYTDVDAIVIVADSDPFINVNTATPTPTLWPGFSINKEDILSSAGSFILSQEGIFIPCKKIPTGFDTPGKKVKISGQMMSCSKFLSCPNCTFFYGQKFILTKIK